MFSILPGMMMLPFFEGQRGIQRPEQRVPWTLGPMWLLLGGDEDDMIPLLSPLNEERSTMAEAHYWQCVYWCLVWYLINLYKSWLIFLGWHLKKLNATKIVPAGAASSELQDTWLQGRRPWSCLKSHRNETSLIVHNCWGLPTLSAKSYQIMQKRENTKPRHETCLGEDCIKKRTLQQSRRWSLSVFTQLRLLRQNSISCTRHKLLGSTSCAFGFVWKLDTLHLLVNNNVSSFPCIQCKSHFQTPSGLWTKTGTR
jgi:hypothetical protein